MRIWLGTKVRLIKKHPIYIGVSGRMPRNPWFMLGFIIGICLILWKGCH